MCDTSTAFLISFFRIMVSIKFYNYNGHYNSVPKTLGDAVTLDGLFRDDYNYTAPTITVTSSTPITYNYCYVPTFDKYYYIYRIEVINSTTYRLYLRLDVLQTYRIAILNSKGTVTESDNANKYASNRNVVYDVRPQFEKISFANSGLFKEDGSIIMITIKGDN